MLVLIFGLPGSGKTTLAKEISNYLNCQFVSTEEIRSFLYEEDDVPDDKDFSQEELTVSYNTVQILAKYMLENDLDIVIEGVFRSSGQRKKLHDLAYESKHPLYSFYLQCDKEILVERLTNRKRGKTISPCGPMTLNEIEQIFEKPKKGENCITVENNGLIKDVKEYMIKMISRG